MSCWKKCIGCTSACACKGLCANPHNRPGVTCHLCTANESSSGEEEEDDADKTVIDNTGAMFDQYFQDVDLEGMCDLDLEGMCEVAPVSIFNDFEEDLEQSYIDAS